MIGWLITVGIAGLLLSMKVGVQLKWESGTALLKVRVGQLRFALSTDKKPKNKKNKKTESKQTPANEPKKDKSSTKKWIKAFISHWRDVLQLIAKILRSPQIDFMQLRIIVGNKDPEKCAMQYGKLCAGLSAGLPVVEQLLPIKKKDVRVDCDFARAKNDIFAVAEATVRLYEILAIAVAGLLLLVRVYRDVKTNEKAVG